MKSRQIEQSNMCIYYNIFFYRYKIIKLNIAMLLYYNIYSNNKSNI